MELQIKHISGSRAGEEQRFAHDSVRIGREPSSDVQFDAYTDLLVSGNHAEIKREGSRWILQDLGSSNGTWISGQKVKIRELRTGERIEFGRGGPMIEVTFDATPLGTSAHADSPAPATVIGVQTLLAGRKPQREDWQQHAAPVEGGTTVMGLDEISPSASTGKQSRRTAQGAPKRRSPLLIGLLVFLMTLVVGVAFIVLTSDTPQQTAESKSAPSQQTSETTEGVQPSPPEEPPASSDAAAQNLTTIDTGSAPGSPESGNLSLDDLDRQYRESQAVIDRLHRELAAKNEELANPKVVIQYVPRYITVPAGTRGTTASAPESSSRGGAAQPPAAQASAAQTPTPSPAPGSPQTVPAATTSAAPSPAETSPLPAVASTSSAPSSVPLAPQQSRAVTTPAQTRVPQPAVAAAVPEPGPPPVLRAPVQTVAEQPPAARETPVPEQPAAAPPPPPQQRIAEIKRLKRRIQVAATPGEFPVPSMPSSFPSAFEKSLTAALVSTGTVLVDKSAPFVVQVTITNYSVNQKKVETARATNLARGIGSLAGLPTPSASASASRSTWDISLSAALNIVDAKGRNVESTRASASVKDRQTSANLSSLGTFGDSSGDSPLHDALREMTASAADNVLRSLHGLELRGTWSGTVTAVKDGVASLDIGRTAGLAPDDVLEVVHSGNGIAQLKVDSVTESTSVAKIIAGSSDLAGKAVRYLGSPFEGQTAPALKEPSRTVRVSRATEGRVGPGNTFQKASTIAAGISFQQVYVLGGWVKVDRGQGNAFWLPVDSVTFE